MSPAQVRRFKHALAVMGITLIGQAAFMFGLAVIVMAFMGEIEALAGNALYEVMSSNTWFWVPAFALWTATVVWRIWLDEKAENNRPSTQ